MIYSRHKSPGEVVQAEAKRLGISVNEFVYGDAHGKPAILSAKCRIAFHFRMERGMSLVQSAKHLRCHHTTIYHYLSRYAEEQIMGDDLLQPWW